MTTQGLSWKSLVVVMGCALVGCSKDRASQDHAAAATVPPPTPKPVAEAPPEPADAEPTLLEREVDAHTLAEAIELAKPEMSDTADEVSRGALLLSLWANTKLRWTDVSVPKNQTSFALVRKDAAASRGKRMCVRGTIIQIQKEDAFFTGLMLTNGSDITSFIAVGSTGELVERRSARFCGVVIGTYDYSNSGGGKGHAVSVVGMFDLPENHARRSL